MAQGSAHRTLRDLLRVLFEHKALAAGVVLCFVIVGLLVALLSTPIYRAEVLLAPVTSAAPGPLAVMPSQFAELMRNAGFDSYDQERHEAIAILRSREFTTDFIQAEGLMPLLFEGEWDADEGEWRESAGGDTPTVWRAYEILDTSVRGIADDYSSGLVTLSIEWTDPVTAARWANAMVEHVNRHLQERAVHEGEQSLEFLTRELGSTGVAEVREAIYSLIESQMQKIMVANVREEYGFRVLDPAVPPEQRERPKRTLILATWLFLGVLASGAAVAWSDSKSRSASSSGGGRGLP
jgi:uncharacterized protein involved in exopolysaccharide biosynthesis